MSNAPEHPTAGDSEEAGRIEGLLNTVGLVAAFILFCLLLVSFDMRTALSQNSKGQIAAGASAGLLFLGGLACLVVSHDNFKNILSPWRPTLRTKTTVLFVVAASLVLCLGLACHLSGGASSPFTQYLIGVGSMGIVVVRSRWTSVFLASASLATYFAVTSVAPILPSPPNRLFFDWFFLTLILLLGILHKFFTSPADPK